MTTGIANQCAVQSRRFLRQAHYELERKGDRVQASKKASGAVAQAVKAIACDRGWRHNSHPLRRQIVDLLAAEFGRPELARLQAIADQLRDNFFEGRFYDWQVRERLNEINALLPSLEEVRGLGANPDFAPSPEQQRVIDRLRLSEEEASAVPLIDYPPAMPPFNPEGS